MQKRFCDECGLEITGSYIYYHTDKGVEIHLDCGKKITVGELYEKLKQHTDNKGSCFGQYAVLYIYSR